MAQRSVQILAAEKREIVKLRASLEALVGLPMADLAEAIPSSSSMREEKPNDHHCQQDRRRTRR